MSDIVKIVDFQTALKEVLDKSGATLTDLTVTSNKITAVIPTEQGVDFGGDYLKQNLQISGSSGHSYVKELEESPAPGSVEYAEIMLNAKQVVIRNSLTDEAIDRTVSQMDSAVNAVKAVQKLGFKEQARDDEFILFSSGFGEIAKTKVNTPASTTIELQDDTDVSVFRFIKDQLGGTKSALKIDIGSIGNLAATRSVTASNYVLGCDAVAKTITLETAVTTANGNVVFRAGQGGYLGSSSTNTQRVINSFDQIINSGELHTLNSSDVPAWQGEVIDGNGTTKANEEWFLEQLQNFEIDNGEEYGSKVKVFTTYEIARKLILDIKKNGVYLSSPIPLVVGLGFKSDATLTANGATVPVITSRDARTGSVYFVDTDTVTRKIARAITIKPLGDTDGFRFDPQYRTYEMFADGKHEMVCSNRRSNKRAFDMIPA